MIEPGTKKEPGKPGKEARAREGRARRGRRAAWRRIGALPRSDKIRLLAWLALVGVLGVVGLGVGDRLQRTEPNVAGTKAAEANALAESRFGERQLLIVVVEGPPRVLRKRGPAVARRIAALPNARVLDPWRSRERVLAPAPGKAMLLVGLDEPFEQVSDHSAPRLRRRLPSIVEPPLEARMTGYTDVAHDIHTTTVHAIERSERIAAPAVLVVLILVLGTLVASSLGMFLGGCVVLAGTGVLDIVNRLTEIDVTALNIATMMGLALGVDYSLLLISRFRSELAEGRSVDEAVDIAAGRAGRTVTFAAAVLALAMAGAVFLLPGEILKSAAVGALVAVGLSVLGARLALPPLLRLVGSDINRLRVMPAGAQSRRWGAFAMRVIRRPLLAGGVGLLVVLAICVPALGLDTGPPSPLVLPEDSEVRQDYEAIDRSVGDGPGRTTPFVVTFSGDRPARGRQARRLARGLTRFKRRVARDRRTLGIVGPEANRSRNAAQFVAFQRVDPEPRYGRALERRADRVARATGTTAVVGGPGPSLDDFDKAAKDNLPLLIGVLVAISYVALVPILKSFILPAIAVVLNVLTVLAAFSVLTLAFAGDAPLGGPGFVDNIMVDMVFSVVLALSIDYEVFLLDRMREGYAITGTVDGAISYGLEHTAGVITGAAAIMLAVFLAFAISPVITMRQLGVGLAVAVALDATIIRLVLLPAALRLAGPRAWQVPRLLDRSRRAQGSPA